MTYSETKFREYIKKLFNDPDIYIKKMPDKKQSIMGAIGLPDYLVITKGVTYWFEVKQAVNKKYTIHTFNLNLISATQWTEFMKMHNAGAKIFVAIYLNKDLYIVPFSRLSVAKFIAGAISIHKDTLYEWRSKNGTQDN